MVDRQMMSREAPEPVAQILTNALQIAGGGRKEAGRRSSLGVEDVAVTPPVAPAGDWGERGIGLAQTT